MAGWLGTWAMLAIALGHADTVRLLAAHSFLAAVRAFCGLEMTGALRLRLGAAEAFLRTRQNALRYDLLVLAASVIVTVLLAGALYARGAGELAIMVVALSPGLPARHPGVVFLAHRDHAVTWRTGIALASLAAGAATLVLGLDWWWAALLFGLRDWGGLLLSLVAAKPQPKPPEPLATPMEFAEVAARTEAVARRRITYRLAKGVLGVVLGPFGSVVARTGRGFRMDARLSRLVPRHRGGMLVFTLATTGVATALVVISREPFLLLVAATAARLAGSAGSALLWWSHGSDVIADEDSDDD